MKIPFAIKSDRTRSKSAVSQTLINMYAEKNPEDPLNPPKYPYTLYPTPGLKPLLEFGTGEGKINGMHVMGNLMFVVNNGDVWTVTTSLVKTLIGTIGTSSGRVMMEDNGEQVGILKPDGTLFVATASTVVEVTNPDYQLSSAMTGADGFLILTPIDTDEFFLSRLNDYTDYDALDFSKAQEKSDFIVRPFSFNNAVWQMGEISMEAFSNTGDADFPYQQIPGAVNTARGIAAKFAIAQEANSFYWLGDDRVVWSINGYTPYRISTHGIESQIEELTVVSDAFMFIYTQDGHKHIILTFPTENVTFVYDITSQLWHNRASYGIGRWIPNAYAFFAGKNIVGHFAAGKLYELDLDTYTDDGTTIQRWIYTQNGYAGSDRFVVDRIELELDAGVGISNGQGSDPSIMMQLSDDGGQTWSNEKWVKMGKIGEYYKRAVWRVLGITRQRIYKFLVSDPVKFQANGLNGDMRKFKA